MSNHISEILMVRNSDGDWIKNDPFWPVATSRITDGARLATLADAKKFHKTATKRAKEGLPLKIVTCIAEYDDRFQIVSIKPKEE